MQASALRLWKRNLKESEFGGFGTISITWQCGVRPYSSTRWVWRTHLALSVGSLMLCTSVRHVDGIIAGLPRTACNRDYRLYGLPTVGLRRDGERGGSTGLCMTVCSTPEEWCDRHMVSLHKRRTRQGSIANSARRLTGFG